MEWIGFASAALASVIVAWITYGSGGYVAKELKTLAAARSALPDDATEAKAALDLAIKQVAGALEDARFERKFRLPRLAVAFACAGLLATLVAFGLALLSGALDSDWFAIISTGATVAGLTGVVGGLTWLLDRLMRK